MRGATPFSRTRNSKVEFFFRDAPLLTSDADMRPRCAPPLTSVQNFL